MNKWYIVGIASALSIICGDVWNITLDVHNRPYTIGSHIKDGHRLFYYSCKWFSDFITPMGFSVGDILIILGLIGLSVFACLLCIKIILSRRRVKTV
jgi:hypothetical protein